MAEKEERRYHRVNQDLAYVTRLLEAGAYPALLAHVNLATTQIYTHVSEDRIANVVSKLYDCR